MSLDEKAQDTVVAAPPTGKLVVRYGSMRRLGVFGTKGDAYSRGTRVVVRTDRGLEVGEVLCEANEQALAQLKDPVRGPLLRAMTPEDENEVLRMRGQERKEFEACREHVARLGLEMNLVDVEHVFGGERIIVYYLAENRVDFRELVKVLAAEFQTRIEMRQIGVRDEAKLLADYGDCGKPVCCNTHLSEMPPVSMKMAKLQKATLDPSKISGRCGRLKCCLRYEYDTYLDLEKALPPVGAEIITRDGRGRVLAQEILSAQVLAEMEDQRRMLVDAKDILTVIPRKGGRPRAKGAADEKTDERRDAPADEKAVDDASVDEADEPEAM
jgi:cell fate regulator YaaT (PSP1 superfamily)